MKKYSGVIGAIVSLIVIFGAGFGVVSYFAKSSDVFELKAEVNYKFLEIRAKDLQNRMWDYEDRYGEDKSKWPKDKLFKWKEWKEEYDAIQRKLDIIYTEQQKKGNG